MPFSTLLFDVADGIARVTVNRPDKLNALNATVIAELGEAVTRIETEPAVQGAILTGAGTKAFVAGADIAELAGQGPLDGQGEVGPGAGGVPAAGALRQARHRRGERLRARRRLRAGDGVSSPDRERDGASSASRR